MNRELPSPSLSLTPVSRRHFLLGTCAAALGPGLMRVGLAKPVQPMPIQLAGPGSTYTPRVHAAFVRRQEDYGMLWPGAVYDGEAARRRYTEEIRKAEKQLGMEVTLRPEPIYSPAEADQWLEEANAAKPDGLLVVLLDRQKHAWPTAQKAAATGRPTLIFAPVGAAFTTNTVNLASLPGVSICSSTDFHQAAYGLKMIKAGAKLREMRYIVIKGTQRVDAEVAHFGTKLRYIPAQSFLDEYNQTTLTEEIKAMAKDYIKQARKVRGPSQQDVLNGLKSYRVARTILEREAGDGITMDCLGALGHTQVSLPCIAWSKMLDDGVPAACEADIGAALTHALVQYLFDRPGFEQDPVPETARECLIGAHCTCPTRLRGFGQKAEPYDLLHHHGNRDAVPRPVWRKGEPVTVADVILPADPKTAKPQLVISTGRVVDNLSVPPAGGCVVSVMVKLDTQPDLLSYPGFHQLFFYGQFKKELLAYCRLFDLEPVVA